MPGLHRRKRETTTADYARMLERMAAGFGRRLAEDEQAWQHLPAIRQALEDAVNRAAYTAVNAGQSPSRMAAAEGATRQAVYKRASHGERLARAAAKVKTMRKAQPRELSAGGN